MSILRSKMFEIRAKGLFYYIDPVLFLMCVFNASVIVLYKILRLLWK